VLSEDRLHFLREHELRFLRNLLPPPCRLLEIGAGTGYQARELQRLGYEVSAVDIPRSSGRLFDVREFDGLSLPFPDDTFDVVFSSNVLEHVEDLSVLLAETRRVLKPSGRCIHAMPTPSWVAWSYLSGFPDIVSVAAKRLKESFGLRSFKRIAGATLVRVYPSRHGAYGSAAGELLRFSRKHWRTVFEQNGFDVLADCPMGLFYTGWSVLGPSISTRTREVAAKYLGSSCRAYTVVPRDSR
jgi:SAM-dependent methyltransferase